MSMEPVYCWTTRDEIEFQNRLIEAGKISALRGLQRAYRFRSWEGRGMTVDRAKVEAHLEQYLKRLTPSPKPEKSHWAIRSVAVDEEG